MSRPTLAGTRHAGSGLHVSGFRPAEGFSPARARAHGAVNTQRLKFRRAIVGCVSLLLIADSALAVTKWKNIQPGTSTRAEVEQALGSPTRTVDASHVEYPPQAGTGPVIVEYRGDGIVDRIEIAFLKAVSRAPLVQQLSLAGTPGAKKPGDDGKLAEYFGSSASVVFFYATAEETGGVKRVGFYSRESFERATGGLPMTGGTPGGPAAPPPPPPPPPPVDWQTTKKTFNPAECQELYYWARTEEQVAKKSGNAVRHQLALDILVSSQKGDCERARKQADLYKQSYK